MNMIFFLLLLIISAFVFLYFVSNQLFGYKPTREEAKMISEISLSIEKFSTHAYKNVKKVLESVEIDRYKAETKSRITQVTIEQTKQLDFEIQQIVNNDLYMAAVKSLVPRNKWKNEFQAKIQEAGQKLLNAEYIEDRIVEAIEEQIDIFYEDIRNSILSEVKSFQFDMISEDSWRLIKDLSRDPGRVKKNVREKQGITKHYYERP